MNRDFKGVWISKEIWLRKSLSIQEKVLAIEIDSLDCGDRHCYASDSYLMEFMGCSRAQLQRTLQKLRSKKVIEVISFDGRERRIISKLKKYLETPDVVNVRQAMSQMCDSSSLGENKGGSNIEENKDNIDIPNGISSTTHQDDVEDRADDKISYDRKKREFVNLTDEKIEKLKRAYPNIDVWQELEKIRLWLEENPAGKRRKGNWKFILGWFSRSDEKREYYQNKKEKPHASPKSEYSHKKYKEFI